MGLTLMRVTFSKEYPGLGEKIKNLRKASSKTITELAAEAGISANHWSRIEREKVQDLPIETLRGIEKALGAELGVEI
ncbi:helix-turn-helix domain-containing protein [Anabaena azotica]|uniref:Helix-turn-helix domain-containing protein n=1 Tax=Anabaena azotica FACHB-119 TaxID=947527 RepID=A0ABR8DFY2_9NOST|nr:helix-turn-helix domain-containing protein [Anabaena azotica]MBD2505549.1 helix-turn-helix domain-containing protein [Anabaena azotica FACHB-119]